MLRRPERLAPDALEFAWEEFAEVIEEAYPLLRRHYGELGLPEPFNPDWKSLFFMAGQRRLRIITLRDRGHIVGYCAGLCINMLACQDKRAIMVNAIYVDPLWRGRLSTIKVFLDMMTDWAHECGASFLEMGPQGRHKRGIGRMLVRLGWSPSDEPCWRLDV